MKSPSPPRNTADRLQSRLDHLERLQADQPGQTLQKAVATMRKIYDLSAKPKHILVRRRFVRRAVKIEVANDRDRTPRLKPPAQTLIRPRGVAFRLYLILLAAAQCPPTGRPASSRLHYPIKGEPDDISLINLIAPGSNPRTGTTYKKGFQQMRAEQVHNALDLLADSDHLLLNRFTPPGPTVQLNIEHGPRVDQDPQPWKRPGNEQVVAIPIDFFSLGWVHVLTDSEIAAWLMFRDYGQIGTHEISDPFTLFADDRLSWYDQSKDVWDTHAMLSAMGLMSSETSPYQPGSGGAKSRRDGTVFRVTDSGLQQHAIPSALAAVAAAKDGVVGLSDL
jgi:hypothetical protein